MPVHAVSWGLGTVSTWTLLGRLPVLLLLGLVLRGGVRRGWPWRASLLATCALVAGLTAGTALLPSVLGALAGGVGAWLLAQRALGLRRPPLAELALGVVLVLAIGRVGCFVNGCCFGVASELPWAVRHDAGSAAFVLHRALGWIGPHDACSRPVHPYPFYETLGLLAWLPIFAALRRRLRSEGALLAATAAWDLALRAGIDRFRGMVNVWWSLLDGRYAFALLAAAASLAALAMVLERRARRRADDAASAVDEGASGDEDGLLAAWVVFGGAWLLGWGAAMNQTPFLRQLLIGALATSIAALRLPRAFSLVTPRAHRLAIGAAAALAIPLGLRLDAIAGTPAVEPARLSTRRSTLEIEGSRGASAAGWRYEVDHLRGVLVRIGAAEEPTQVVEARREALGLPQGGAPARQGRLWVAGGFAGGSTNYEVTDGCNGGYTIYDRRSIQGFGQVEWEQPVTGDTVAWFGGRGGWVHESGSVRSCCSAPAGVETRADVSAWSAYGQAWVELENPYYSVGVGGVAFDSRLEERADGGVHWKNASGLRPGGHLRLGFSFLGLDAAYADRTTPFGFPGARLGLSGGIWSTDVPGRNPDDVKFRYFVGAQSFPSGIPSRDRFGGGLSLELHLPDRHVLGADAVILEGGAVAGVRYAFALGPPRRP